MADNKSFWQMLLDAGLQALNNNKPKIQEAVTKAVVNEVQKPVASVVVQETAPVKSDIDWTKGEVHVSEHFTVKDMIFLPSWNRLANEADGLDAATKANLIDLAKHMELARAFFGKPIITHVTLRPVEYNKTIPGAALHSAHTEGKAMDFHVADIDCATARKMINDANKLQEWGMRMEDITGNWVHLDTRPLKPGGNRFFKP